MTPADLDTVRVLIAELLQSPRVERKRQYAIAYHLRLLLFGADGTSVPGATLDPRTAQLRDLADDLRAAERELAGEPATASGAAAERRARAQDRATRLEAQLIALALRG